MGDAVRKALQRDRVIDITTKGRKTGKARRIEIWFHNVEGRLFISGSPGRRDWYANLLTHPDFTFHLKQSAQADLAAKATPIVDKGQRREIFGKIHQGLGGGRDLETWVEGSPLVEVHLEVWKGP